jgi:hypothetical protein
VASAGSSDRYTATSAPCSAVVFQHKTNNTGRNGCMSVHRQWKGGGERENGRERGALGPARSVRQKPGQHAFTNTPDLPAAERGEPSVNEHEQAYTRGGRAKSEYLFGLLASMRASTRVSALVPA